MPPPQDQSTPPPPLGEIVTERTYSKPIILAFFVLLIAAVAGAGWWYSQKSNMSPSAIESSTLQQEGVTVNDDEASPAGTTAQCKVPQHDLYLGVSDATTNGDVTLLQQFLMDQPISSEKNYFSGPITGHFDSSTQSALDRWQKEHTIALGGPPEGMFGPRSRALMTITKCNKLPVMSEVSGPTTLAVNQSGTWKVEAADPENDPLTYTVVWGDAFEGFPVANQSSTFTHTYTKPGTYTIQIAVHDGHDRSNGKNVTRTAVTVTVR